MSANLGATRLDIELTPDLRAKYYALGGAAWLRDTLAQASTDHVKDRPMRALTKQEHQAIAVDAVLHGNKAAARKHNVSLQTVYYLRRRHAQNQRG